ncbi:SubName: Full=Uncharacterized protein {ECO:0000313/EMBL:CCA67516.1} [Serendipita indica DSM 11827]|nr:SubName: Full=Uncharacterized protein {ECO:0000313/EMBL:CCA67516.1} [Serendipita indica DSM 11827]
MAGWTVFKNLYIYGNTIYIVTSQPEILPPLRFIFSNGLPLEMQEDNEPDQRTVAVVSPHEADILFGGSAGLLDGVSFLQTDAPQFLHHMYHMVVEIFALGHWRTLSSTELDSTFGGSDRPGPRRLVFAHCSREGWRDRAGMNEWVLQAAFGGMSIEFQDTWDFRMNIGKPFVFELVVLGDRAASHREHSWKDPSTPLPISIKHDWWSPIRESVIAFATSGLPPKSILKKPIVTYISRQRTGRRLREDDHNQLVASLRQLGQRYDYEIQIPIMEDLPKSEQILLLSQTTVLVGVHGNGLSNQLWLRPSPRTTVIEIFFPGGFAFDYEYTARSLGLKHYGFWLDRFFSAPNLPPNT